MLKCICTTANTDTVGDYQFLNLVEAKIVAQKGL